MVTAAEYSVKIRGEYKFVTILEKKFKRYGFANLNSIDDRILKKMNVGVSGIIQQCGFVAKRLGSLRSEVARSKGDKSNKEKLLAAIQATIKRLTALLLKAIERQKIIKEARKK